VRLLNYLLCSLTFITCLPGLAETASFSRQTLALEAANAVYDLPDINMLSRRKPIEEWFTKLREHSPEGYRLVKTWNEPDSGLKLIVLRPDGGDTDPRPWIVAIAGSESFIDWIGDLDYGANQVPGLEPIKAWLIHRKLINRDILLTGHSLGGVLSQVLAYRLQKERLKQGTQTGKVHLVTWNCPGALPLLRRFDGPIDPAVTAGIDIQNYFVKGEFLSTVGHHLGPTYELPPPSAAFKRPGYLPEAVWHHKIGAVFNIVEQRPGTLTEAKPKKPFFRRAFTSFVTKAGLFRHLLQNAWGLRAGIQRRRLTREFQRLSERANHTPETMAAYRYLHAMTNYLLNHMDASERAGRSASRLLREDHRALQAIFGPNIATFD
jgi:hypothetical protein